MDGNHLGNLAWSYHHDNPPALLKEDGSLTLYGAFVKDYVVAMDGVLPTVTIVASDATATEAGPTAGQFRVTRTGSTAAALAVSYTVSGTATTGDDYVPLAGSVAIGAGSSTATITVTPVNDTEVEIPETVVATLGADAAYTVGAPSNATVTISSDDRLPTVQFSLAASSGLEGTTPAEIRATLSAASNHEITVHYATANGTAAAGSDYTATAGILTFDPGVTSQTIMVPVTGDATIEASETFTVTLTAPVNATLGALPRHTYTIANDDFRGSIRLSSALSSVGEAAPTVTVTAMRVGGSSGAVGIGYATANGTAIAGADYTAAVGRLSWADGDTADKDIVVTLADDARDERDEKFTVRLFTPTGGATLGSPGLETVTIVDDDPTPTVAFGAAASAGAESTTPAVLAVTLSAASGQTVTVRYATANGTATAGGDYGAVAGALVFAPGVTSRTINVPIVDNAIVEPDESFTVTLTSPVNADLGATTAHTYTVNDEDVAGAIRLSVAAAAVSELGPAVRITAMRVGGSSGAVGVSYETADGTATAGSDYLAAAGSLAWASGDRANKTITVPIATDALDEPNKTFTVTLSLPTGGAILGRPATETVTIVDDDPTPTVQFGLAASSGAESMTPAEITVTLSAASGRTVTVTYATVKGTAAAVSDYAATAGTLTFGPGVTSRTISVPIIDDAVVEPNQTFAVALAKPVNAILGARYLHVHTITNDDPHGSIQLGLALASVGEAGPTVVITARRVGGSSGAVGVGYATANGTAIAGADYTAAVGRLDWADGDAADKDIVVTLTDDALDERDEKFAVRLSTPTGGATLGSPSLVTVTIVDDDPTPTVAFGAAASAGAESTTPAVLAVALSAASGQTVTVQYATANGTAVSGSDYAARSGTLTFAPGVTSRTIAVPIVHTAIAEPDESFTVTLTNPVNATLGATPTHTYSIRE
jgi:ribosomal protein S7